jgi:2-iminobutanoate/2-iminopropanoate deaminase
MKRQIIRTTDAPTSPLYSQAVKVGGTIHVSGTVGIDVKTNKLAGTTIQEQTHQAIVNCRSILAAAGATLDDVVSVLVLLANPADFAGMNEEYAKFFASDLDSTGFPFNVPGSNGVCCIARIAARSKSLLAVDWMTVTSNGLPFVWNIRASSTQQLCTFIALSGASLKLFW